MKLSLSARGLSPRRASVTIRTVLQMKLREALNRNKSSCVTREGSSLHPLYWFGCRSPQTPSPWMRSYPLYCAQNSRLAVEAKYFSACSVERVHHLAPPAEPDARGSLKARPRRRSIRPKNPSTPRWRSQATEKKVQCCPLRQIAINKTGCRIQTPSFSRQTGDMSPSLTASYTKSLL